MAGPSRVRPGGGASSKPGRLRPDADPWAAAALLLGACFQRAFFLHYSGAHVVQPVEGSAPAAARTGWAAIR
ncbi:hypothetical protein [Streptomyces sp. NPDC093514]|uniref:hypothetical protein n=1 Tax=Streptomyces sp. NPDC093514 TaxID=3366039 RepID=UPI003803748E